MQYTREAVISTALEVFNEKGMRFTMDDIARRMGMSKKTIYTIFADKNTLLEQAVDWVFDAIKVEERKILEDDTLPLAEKIERIMIVMPGRYRDLNLNQIATVEQRSPKLYKKLRTRLESDWEPTLALLQQGIDAGEIRAVPLPIIKAMVEGTIEQLFSGGLAACGGMSYEQVLEAMMDIVMRGIKTAQ